VVAAAVRVLSPCLLPAPRTIRTLRHNPEKNSVCQLEPGRGAGYTLAANDPDKVFHGRGANPVMEARKLTHHLKRDRYGNFSLTDAIRPSFPVTITPVEGFRVHHYQNKTHGLRLPVLTAAVSREQLFDVFLALVKPLGPVVDVILESSADQESDHKREYDREAVDLPILTSYCCDFEELLVNDGCTGIAVLNEELQMEVHFDEHKLLYVYAPFLWKFERIMASFAVPRIDDLQLITEAEHIHCTHPNYRSQFDQMATLLGVEEAVGFEMW
jgi:hypothetical protein